MDELGVGYTSPRNLTIISVLCCERHFVQHLKNSALGTKDSTFQYLAEWGIWFHKVMSHMTKS
jgi:hypothetical protein